MANINTFLLRDTLVDDGKAVHHQYDSSPDLICYPQVMDPQTFFTDNYGSDVTRAVDKNSRTNPLYVRGKNMTGSPLQGRIQVYRACFSLFMTPSIWRNNKLYTAPVDDDPPFDYVSFSAASNGIAVGEAPFVIDGTQGNFCLVGIASDNAGPVIPPDFDSYDKFIQWVTSNPGVCVRNQSVRAIGQRADMELAARIMNPEDIIKEGFLQVKVESMPTGTTLTARNTALQYEYEYKTVQTDDGFVSEVPIPPHFDGFFTGTVQAPGPIPSNAKFTMIYYYILPPDSPVYHLGTAAEALLADTKGGEVALQTLVGRMLVRLGSCTIQAQ
ncbi:MAG: hypothetical protein LBS06_05580 [Treponema sp.]|jgi:hypothetical protein|nr:hypothetical protein [Treponema sp.]